MELVDSASKLQRPARVSLNMRLTSCSSPARTSSVLMNGYSFSKASSTGFGVSIAIDVYQTSLPSDERRLRLRVQVGAEGE